MYMGIRRMGQALAQRAQLMQGPALSVFSSSAVRKSRAPVALEVRAARLNWAKPIMGPPEITLRASAFSPPQNSSTSAKLTPVGTSRFWALTAPPETVITRS